MKDEIMALVCEAYKEVLDSEGIKFDKSKKIDSETPIYGNEGCLDSLGFVILVVAIEAKVREKFNVSVSIANEKAMLNKESLFKDIKAITVYLKELLNGKIADES